MACAGEAAERPIEALQFLRGQASADVAGIAAVEHHELPPVGRVGAAHLERRAARAIRRMMSGSS